MNTQKNKTKGALKIVEPDYIPQFIPPPWPVFDAATKPSNNSPWTTTLQFWRKGHPSCVRIIVEGRSEELVNRYASTISDLVAPKPVAHALPHTAGKLTCRVCNGEGQYRSGEGVYEGCTRCNGTGLAP